MEKLQAELAKLESQLASLNLGSNFFMVDYRLAGQSIMERIAKIKKMLLDL